MGDPHQRASLKDFHQSQTEAPKKVSAINPLLGEDSRGAAKRKATLDNLAKVSVAENPLKPAETAAAVKYNQRAPRKDYNWEAIAAKLGAPTTANDERMAQTIASKQDALKIGETPDGKLETKTITALELKAETIGYLKKQQNDPKKENAKKVEKPSGQSKLMDYTPKTEEEDQKDPLSKGTLKKERQNGAEAIDFTALKDLNAIETKLDVGSIRAWYATQGYTKDTKKAIQKAVGLKDKGIDGDIGKGSIEHIMKWQASKGLKEDGRFNQECADIASIKLEKTDTNEFKVPEAERFNNLNDKVFQGDQGDDKKKGILNSLFGFTPQFKVDKGQAAGDESKIKKQMTTVSVPIHDINGNINSISLTIHNKLAANVKAIFNEIFIEYPEFRIINQKNCCGYNYRPIKKGDGKPSNTLSNHSFGTAFDINSSVNKYRKDKDGNANQKPLASGDTDTEMRTLGHQVVQICAKHGFGWGGQYGDDMHFSIFNGG